MYVYIDIHAVMADTHDNTHLGINMAPPAG